MYWLFSRTFLKLSWGLQHTQPRFCVLYVRHCSRDRRVNVIKYTKVKIFSILRKPLQFLFWFPRVWTCNNIKHRFGAVLWRHWHVTWHLNYNIIITQSCHHTGASAALLQPKWWGHAPMWCFPDRIGSHPASVRAACKLRFTSSYFNGDAIRANWKRAPTYCVRVGEIWQVDLWSWHCPRKNRPQAPRGNL